MRKTLLYFVSFSVGGLFGDAFIHLIPEVVREVGFTLHISLYILFGIVSSFAIEKLFQWRHCHIPTSVDHPHPFAYMNLFGDAIHNFIDGAVIAGSYISGFHLGVATTLAVIFHEIPQEIGDFGVLVYGGFGRSKALLFNFLTTITAILGALFALIVGIYFENINMFLIPFAAGSFIYIAGSDLIPELHKESEISKSLIQLLAFILGVLVILFPIYL